MILYQICSFKHIYCMEVFYFDSDETKKLAISTLILFHYWMKPDDATMQQSQNALCILCANFFEKSTET